MRLLALPVSLGLLLGACGGANDAGLFGGNGQQSGADAGNHHDASSNPPPEQDGSTNPPPEVDSGTHPPPPADAGNPPPPPPTDAGKPGVDAGDDPGVRCGDLSTATYCTVPGQECCRRDVGGVTNNMCVSSSNSNPCPAGLEIPCDDARDCEAAGMPGFVCCAQGGTPATSVTCVDPQQCNGAVLCNPTQPNQCPNGMNCSQSTQTIPGYDICK